MYPIAFTMRIACLFPPCDPVLCNRSSHGRAGREYYNNICMRAVNQSIGRSIRHARDYASILLVDERYHDDQVKDGSRLVMFDQL